METVQQEEQQKEFIEEEHPWLTMTDSSLDEDLRYSLDEIRFA